MSGLLVLGVNNNFFSLEGTLTYDEQVHSSNDIGKLIELKKVKPTI